MLRFGLHLEAFSLPFYFPFLFLPPALFPFSIASIPRRYLETSNFSEIPPLARKTRFGLWLSRRLSGTFPQHTGLGKVVPWRARAQRQAGKKGHRGRPDRKERGDLMGWLEGCAWCVGEVVVKLWTVTVTATVMVQVRWSVGPGDVAEENTSLFGSIWWFIDRVCGVVWCLCGTMPGTVPLA